MTRRMWVMGLLVVACSVYLTGCQSWGKRKKRSTDGMNDAALLQPFDSELDGFTASVPPRPDSITPLGQQFDTVFFDYDSSQIRPAERPKIQSVADYLRRAMGGTQVIVEGHCDERGSEDYNMALGERRAQAVRAYLIGLGVDASRIQTRSYGEERPADPGHGEAAWNRNRRVEFLVFQ